MAVRAQTVEFRATLTAAQETPASTSAASGTAVMIYDVAANTFDLVVTINNFSNTVTASHIHEGGLGVAGPIVTNLGSETAYVRNGNTLTTVFHSVTHGGAKLTLLQNGAYYNLHSVQFPGGEIRGQLIAQPKRLVANMNVAQEQAAFPTTALTGVANGFGGAVMTYNPGTNKINLRLNIYNYTNTLTLSHYHEGAPAVSGPVVTNLGAQTVSNYVRDGNMITGTFIDLTYAGDPIKLLTGGAYLNFHSNIFPAGECRGQVLPSEEVLSSRVSNLAARGFVGTGDQVLIGGLVVTGSEPVRVMISAKGPSLTAAGLNGVLANPRLTIFDSAGRQMATNDDIGVVTPSSEFSGLPGTPTNSVESALILILPAGNYTAVVSGNGGTGIALLECTDLRNVSSILANAAADKVFVQRTAVPFRGGPAASGIFVRKGPPVAPELCVVPPALAANATTVSSTSGNQ